MKIFVELYKIKKKYIRKYSGVEVAGVNENLSSSKCKQNSVILRVGRGTEKDSTISSQNRERKEV